MEDWDWWNTGMGVRRDKQIVLSEDEVLQGDMSLACVLTGLFVGCIMLIQLF